MTSPYNDDPADDTPTCLECGQQVGLRVDAYVALKGMWMWSEEHDVEIFVLDPKTQMAIIQLPNDQLAISTDRGTVTRHVDASCFELAFDENDENENDEDRFFGKIAGGYR